MHRRTIAAEIMLMVPLWAAPLGGPRRQYVDTANGVRFAYPAAWLLNADDDAATAKLRIVTAGQPAAVVQLEGNFAGSGPYQGTDFEAGAFAFVALPAVSEQACFAVLERSGDDKQKAMRLTWKGLPAENLNLTATVAGTDDTHRIFAVYRAGQCLFFETVIVSKSVGLGIEPLSPARWKQLRAEFDGVLESVRIAHPPQAGH